MCCGHNKTYTLSLFTHSKLRHLLEHCSKKRKGQELFCPSNLPSLHPLLRTELIIVDLRALELVGIIDVHRLPLGEEIDRGDSRFAVAVAGLLGAPEGQVSLRANRRRVYVDNSRVEIARGLESAVHVSRVNGSRKS